ncbi:DUF6735 family protein [Halorussus halophilus]|uniref:DUF6735 family protein n=1 Tax=Halorussus halophilus TaxID=2650975 RepID=UPI001300E15C|nr:DUF6735 family protein [Halorussus halophilus]
MGHRALLAYERADGNYDLHRSHWGGANFALADAITVDDPFADRVAGTVDFEPLATDLELTEIVADHLDFLHHEAFYRVARNYEVTPFHVCWFGLEAECETVERSETVGNGVAVEAEPPDDYFRGWFRGTKATVAELVDRGLFAPDDAREYLVTRIASWASEREVL